MPWMIQKDGDQFCVYKEAEDGSAMGDSLGCHGTRKEAEDQMAALYANEPDAGRKRMSVIETLQREFAGILARLRGDEERSLSLQLIAEQVMGQIDALAQSVGGWPVINDLYTEADGSLSIVFSMNGRLYKAPITMDGTTAIMGSLIEVEPQFMPTRSISIVRQANGRARWLAVAAASVLNRVGEIDSQALFDSFVAKAEKHGLPQLRFYHDARLVLGQADWTARNANLYLASGLADDGPLGAAFVDACEKGRGVWGCSIGFMPTKPPDMVEISRGVSVPVYTEGVNTEISVLPEGAAASWFTSIGLEVTRTMDEAKKKALALLLGDEELAAKFLADTEATNRQITEAGLITRETELPAASQPPAEPQPPAAPEETPETERHATTDAEKTQKAAAEEKAQYEKDLIAKVLEATGIAAISERLGKLEKALADMTGGEAARTQERTDLATRLAAMETIVTRWQREREIDMPANRTLSATYRPREQAATEPGAFSTESTAAATLGALKQKK